MAGCPTLCAAMGGNAIQHHAALTAIRPAFLTRCTIQCASRRQPAERAKERSPGRGVPNARRFCAWWGAREPGVRLAKRSLPLCRRLRRLRGVRAARRNPERSRETSRSRLRRSANKKSFSRTASLRRVVRVLAIRFCRPLKLASALRASVTAEAVTYLQPTPGLRRGLPSVARCARSLAMSSPAR